MFPADIIVEISQYYTVATDFVHFGMINKRHYGLLLEHIKRHDHNQSCALQRFVKRGIWLRGDSIAAIADVSYMEILPSWTIHGTREEWFLDDGVENLRRIINGRGDPWIVWIGPDECEKQQAVLKYCKSRQERRSPDTHAFEKFFMGRHFGRHQVYRYSNPEQLIVEGYYGGVLKEVEVDNHGEDRPHFEQSKKEGQEIHYFHSGLIHKRLNYKSDEPHGEAEVFSELGGQVFLIQRAHYHKGKFQGIQECWEGTYGVRTALYNFDQGQQHGENFEWHPNGTRKSYFTCEHGTLQQEFEYEEKG